MCQVAPNTNRFKSPRHFERRLINDVCVYVPRFWRIRFGVGCGQLLHDEQEKQTSELAFSKGGLSMEGSARARRARVPGTDLVRASRSVVVPRSFDPAGRGVLALLARRSTSPPTAWRRFPRSTISEELSSVACRRTRIVTCVSGMSLEVAN